MARQLSEYLDKEDAKPATIFVDSKYAIQLSKNPVFHDRNKHIEVRFHFIRESIEQGKITIEHICPDDQLADIVTKHRFQDFARSHWRHRRQVIHHS
jgi:hypothetical protein